MKKSITRFLAIFLAATALIAFAGCELTGTDFLDSGESRKGKPTAETTVTRPPVFSGVDGPESALAEEDYIVNYFIDETLIGVEYALEPFAFTPETETISFFYYDSSGERVAVDENDPLATHKLTTIEGTQALTPEVIGQRIIGWESTVYDLWAGQDSYAGSVTISNDNENFYILIDTNETADLQEAHIYLYNEAGELPDKRPAPGQAPYTLENIYADSVEFVIPVSALVDLEDYYFIIHAALVEDASGSVDGTSNAGETAYAGGEGPGFDSKGSWFYAANYTLTAVYEDIIGYLIETVIQEEIEELDVNKGGGDDPVAGIWGEETAYAGNVLMNIGEKGAWWLYIDTSLSTEAIITVPIYAGQHLVPGAFVSYNKETGDLSFDFGDNMRLQDDAESIKIQGYGLEELPDVRPPSGPFTTLKTNSTVDTNIGVYPYVVIHFDSEILQPEE